MNEIMIKIDHVSKQYKLGQIGGTTLKEELQRKHARRHGKEDPTKMIGAKDYEPGETFMALDDVSFEVKKGERVGIIGHNGAGKSTLLKLISRVTAPTGGMIGLNGRITSMLEVGTGFHGELTGRENIYMNGAILGMTRKEIDAKIEDIIDFSEVRQFIDTPVKRYSSGMYVKLAFSVAAHLDSEIMIMDEVLAVGDMAFQKKCLNKMNDVSKTQGRTILYVSHNMNTIRQLCERCIVLDHGHIVFDGDVEDAIALYLDAKEQGFDNVFDLTEMPRHDSITGSIFINKVEILNQIPLTTGESLRVRLHWTVKDHNIHYSVLRFLVGEQGHLIGISMSKDVEMTDQRQNCKEIELNTSFLAPGQYFLNVEMFDLESGHQKMHEGVRACQFEIIDDVEQTKSFQWYKPWGHIKFDDLKVM